MSAELKARQTAAELARQRVKADMDALLHSLAPSTLVKDGIDGARSKAKEIAGDAADFVKERPIGTGAVVGGVAAVGIWKFVSSWRETRAAKKR